MGGHHRPRKSTYGPFYFLQRIKKVTGRGWEDVLARGSPWALRHFLNELRAWDKQRPHRHVAPPRRLPPVASRGRGSRHPHAPLRLS